MFPYFFPRKGTLTSTPVMGMGGGPFRTPPNPPKSQNISKKEFVRKSFTLLDNFQKMPNNIFKICSYIQKIH